MKKILAITMGLVLICSLEVLGFGGGFGDDFGSSTSELEVEGSLEFDTRIILDDSSDYPLNSFPTLDLDLSYEKANSDFQAALNFDSEGNANIEEGFIRLFYDDFDISAGRQKIVWGKGDKLHVVDNFNAQDLTDFINPDYLDRKIGQEMVRLNYYLGSGNLELVYSPQFSPNKLATQGEWSSPQLAELRTNFIEQFGEVAALRLQEELKGASRGLKYGQAGLRYTNSKSGYDYGFSFYQGRLKNPSMNREAINSLNNDDCDDYDKDDYDEFLADLNLDYDRVSVFGAEFSSVIAGINARGELAYYLTEDTDGDNPSIHNNRVAWLIGGDKDLDWSNLNLNVQLKSELILNDDEIKDNPFHIDYNEDGDYFTNMLVFKLSDSFKNERVLPEMSLVYNIEAQDYMLDNEIEFLLKDDTSFIVNYKIFSGDEHTTFGQFSDNDYLAARLKYSF
ncbi:hypothetical protein MWH25_07180 [Natroniella acetigena]|uniref:DUF1302 family protein n=1 Tax=Natroniella acetigena TaxID=52004 RepID=UPI00200AE684|nr:DUF1302 family protein [Natroniella acetigena]MCK8827523.1 hypothetical protein [Natroniella acetigena]